VPESIIPKKVRKHEANRSNGQTPESHDRGRGAQQKPGGHTRDQTHGNGRENHVFKPGGVDVIGPEAQFIEVIPRC
jgi:hypothetical protein